MSHMPTIGRRLTAEFLGTFFLIATIIGAGIMADALTSDVGVALIGTALPIGAILYVIIVLFGPISGAHFNPAVTLVFRLRGELSNSDTLTYIATQIVAGIAAVVAVHFFFGLDLIQAATNDRGGEHIWVSEVVATFGLLVTVLLGIKYKVEAVPALVGSYIFAAIWFTSSTAFANPAVTLARTLTNTFTGIHMSHAPSFILAEIIGAVAALYLCRWLVRDE